jgi:glycosyltransferase involved in cell wall biosynthesis
MAEKKKSVEFVIPIYNEEAELELNVRKLHSFLTHNLKDYLWHITIADNASTDKSLFIAKKLSKKIANFGLFHLDKKGRGRAVKSVWKNSNAEILMYMDVDLSTDLKSIKPLLDSLQRNYDIAIGSRLLRGSKVKGRTLRREVLSRVYNILIKLFFQVRFSDAQCGFKAVTKKVVNNLLPYVKDNAWFFDSELLIIAEKTGYKIHEEPVVWIDNPGSTVRVLKTVHGDLEGLWRLFWNRPWKGIKNND